VTRKLVQFQGLTNSYCVPVRTFEGLSLLGISLRFRGSTIRFSLKIVWYFYYEGRWFSWVTTNRIQGTPKLKELTLWEDLVPQFFGKSICIKKHKEYGATFPFQNYLSHLLYQLLPNSIRQDILNAEHVREQVRNDLIGTSSGPDTCQVDHWLLNTSSTSNKISLVVRMCSLNCQQFLSLVPAWKFCDNFFFFACPDSPSRLLPFTVRNSSPNSASLYTKRRMYGCLFMCSSCISNLSTYLYQFMMVDGLHNVVLHTLIRLWDQNKDCLFPHFFPRKKVIDSVRREGQ
jgi:hypothetical protein